MIEVDVKALAKLAGLDIPPEELASLEKEIPAILAFVGVVQNAPVDASNDASERERMGAD